MVYLSGEQIRQQLEEEKQKSPQLLSLYENNTISDDGLRALYRLIAALRMTKTVLNEDKNFKSYDDKYPLTITKSYTTEYEIKTLNEIISI